MSDFFDFSIYVDAEESDIEAWYRSRFRTLVAAARTDEGAFFHRFESFTDDEADELAGEIWASVNRPNLHQNVLPTRDRADLVLEKGRDHTVRRVRLRLR